VFESPKQTIVFKRRPMLAVRLASTRLSAEPPGPHAA